MKHLLVTNDYPPKIGGIQNYLWELWRRLPPKSTAVYCTPYAGSVSFDVGEPYRIERSPEPVLIPYPWLPKRIDALADEVGADLILLDPAVPLGLVGPFLRHPYGVLLHGAEVTIPGRLPLAKRLLSRVLDDADIVVSAGRYALEEAERCVGRPLRSIIVPPGVDTTRFRPLDALQKQQARQRFDLSPDALVVAAVNRLVPRKGMDILVRAAAQLQYRIPSLQVMIGGTGREFDRLTRLTRELSAPVRLLGRLDDAEVPFLYGASDVMAMPCHDRWRGLEQEGFGIAFLEAAAAGIPQIAGRSGGAHEAVAHDVSGLVVDQPKSVDAVAGAIAELLMNHDYRIKMGAAARRRAIERFDYTILAQRLHTGLQALNASPPHASSP